MQSEHHNGPPSTCSSKIRSVFRVARLSVYRKRRTVMVFWSAFHAAGYHLNGVLSFTARWTVQSIYATICFLFLWLLYIFQQVGLLVACLTRLTFCVSALCVSGIFICLLFFSFLWHYWMIFKTWNLCKELAVCRKTYGVNFSTGCMENLRPDQKNTKRQNKKNTLFFGGPCGRLHYFSIGCAISGSWMFVHLCSDTTTCPPPSLVVE